MTAFYLFNLHFLLVAQAQQLEPHKKNILKVHKKLGNVRDPWLVVMAIFSVYHLNEATVVAAVP